MQSLSFQNQTIQFREAAPDVSLDPTHKNKLRYLLNEWKASRKAPTNFLDLKDAIYKFYELLAS